jgi:integrase
MASLSTDSNGNRTLQFVAGDGKRRSIRLGKVPKKVAESIKVRVEYLNAAKIGNTTPDNETASWVSKVSDDLYARLAGVGLVAARGRSAAITLADYWKEFVSGKRTLKPRSVVAMNQVAERAGRFFGADKAVADVSAGDAERFADWLRSEYAQATAARTLKRIKQVFTRAVKDRLVDANPFDGIRPGCMSNPARLRYIPAADVLRVMDAAPGWEWRTVIALARFAGLRVPSELAGLTWADVNWDARRLVIHSPKLEKSASRGVRVVPILPELMPHLRTAFEAATDGEIMVAPQLGRVRSGNLRTAMRRTIKRAGLLPWERTFQNLRSSFVIDLHERFPAHVASRWAGHTDRTALAHYLDVLDAHFDRASGRDGAAESGADALQKPVQTATGTKRQEKPIPSEVFERDSVSRSQSSTVTSGPRIPVAPA